MSELLRIIIAVLTIATSLPPCEQAPASSVSIFGDRKIDWSQAGVWADGIKGIPEYPVGITCVTPKYKVYPNQTADSAVGIQAAINDCQPGRAVYLPAGTYTLNGQIKLKPRMALRGAGAGRTVLDSRVTNAVQFGSPRLYTATRYGVSGGVAKGGKALVLADPPPAACKAGTLVLIDELPDYDVVWVRNTYSERDVRRHSFLARVTGVKGKEISFFPPNPYPFKTEASPQARFRSGSDLCSLSGVEDLTIMGSTDRGLYFIESDRCWSKDVEVAGFEGGHGMIQVDRSLQTEIRGNYVHDCAGFPAQADGYGIMPYYDSCYTLIEDNVFNRTAAPILGAGTSGNVYGYNYMRQIGRTSWKAVQYGINCNHGPFATMCLIEGNIMPQFENDGYHGSASHQVLFRNVIDGISYDGFTDLRWLVNLARASYYHSCIGNVLGDPSWKPNKYEMTVANGGGGYSTSCIYKLEYPNSGNTSLTPATTWTNWTVPFPDPRVRDTLIRHANYDYYNKAVICEPGQENDIPDSLYLPSKPSWFGALDWPPIGPDVAGFKKDIPAKARWDAYLSSGCLADLFSE